MLLVGTYSIYKEIMSSLRGFRIPYYYYHHRGNIIILYVYTCTLSMVKAGTSNSTVVTCNLYCIVHVLYYYDVCTV